MKVHWLALGLVGCNPFFNVPKDAQGDLPIELKNSLDADLCEFSMEPPGALPSSSWLKHTLKPGVERNFKIKPGQYKVAVGCGVNFHGTTTREFKTATTIEVALAGSAPTAPNAVVVPVTGNVGRFIPLHAAPQAQPAEPPEQPAAADEQKACLPDGTHMSATTSTPCCSGKDRNTSNGYEECCSVDGGGWTCNAR
jgi:hypothetical protein